MTPYNNEFDAPGGDNQAVYSVSTLNRLARNALEREFFGILVEGEISDLLQHRSGHWYFTLKDEDAQLRAAMFRFQNRGVRFQPENGQQVLLRGKLSLYEPRGSYQFIAETMEPAGLGKLQQQFERLKLRLEQEGLFDPMHKVPLPAFPQQVVIITSPQGAAIRDMQSTFARRFPGIELLVIPVAVQGDIAAGQIANAIDWANELATRRRTAWQPDAIIVGRGGGSLEDLWAFNEEVVARAIYQSQLPVVSAVGHETDFTIADFVADVRAATPTAAAELLSPSAREMSSQIHHFGERLAQLAYNLVHRNSLQLSAIAGRLRHPGQQVMELAQRLDTIDTRLLYLMEARLANEKWALASLHKELYTNSPAVMAEQLGAKLEQLQLRLQRAANDLLAGSRQRFEQLTSTLHVVSPLATLQRGYTITADASGNILRNSDTVKPGDTINTRLGEGKIESTVTRKE